MLHLFNDSHVKNTQWPNYFDEGGITSLIANAFKVMTNVSIVNTNMPGEVLNASIHINVIPQEVVHSTAVVANMSVDCVGTVIQEVSNVSIHMKIASEEMIPSYTVIENVSMNFADVSKKMSTASTHIDVTSKEIVDASKSIMDVCNVDNTVHVTPTVSSITNLHSSSKGVDSIKNLQQELEALKKKLAKFKLQEKLNRS
ncbi:PREDICTED: uncharacterized protein LOC108770315 isoform X2 [Trachymyrmex cornetzi]|nr:PREDICTED: uncharacterized protein LOC108770315 isoform X2 [Trachymyrmex cornetzi]